MLIGGLEWRKSIQPHKCWERLWLVSLKTMKQRSQNIFGRILLLNIGQVLLRSTYLYKSMVVREESFGR